MDEFEEILSKKLEPKQVTRLMKFLRFMQGTPDEIENSLVSDKQTSIKLNSFNVRLLFFRSLCTEKALLG